MSDERHNLPSASGYSRLLNCPGSWRMEQPFPSTSTEDSRTGDRIHAWLAGELNDDALTEDELKIGEQCHFLANAAIMEWRSKFHGVYESLTILEERIWLHDGLRPIFSGKPDLVMLSGNQEHALILDYKTLHGDHQPSSENDQLRALAVLVSQEFGSRTVTVGIVQPWKGMRVQLATFLSEHLSIAAQELRDALDAANQPDAPLRMGKWCAWCKAKSVCPKQQENLAEIKAVELAGQSTKLITPERVGELLDACVQAERMIKAIRDHAKRMIEEGQEVPGWQMVDTAPRRSIVNQQRLLDEIKQAFGVGNDELLELASFSIGDIEKLIKDRGSMKPKQVKEWMQSNLAGCIELKSAGKKLEKITNE